MEKQVFREFMVNEVIQKTVIFADAFNLNIENWKSANSVEHPYRINFFSGDMLVGHIDALVDDIGTSKYVRPEMPFTLFTPFGRITGLFSSHSGQFNYDIGSRKDAFKKIYGSFNVKKSAPETGEKYYIASSIILNDLENNRINVVFNRMPSVYTVGISKENENGTETAKLCCKGYYSSIEHFIYSKFGERQDFTNIIIELDARENTFPVSYEFSNSCSCQKGIEIRDNLLQYGPYRKRLGSIDFNIIGAEIAENDPEMFSFIDEVREALMLPANGITPISIYDKMAGLCFSSEIDKFLINFSRAQSTRTAFTHNLVLERMEKQGQERKSH